MHFRTTKVLTLDKLTSNDTITRANIKHFDKSEGSYTQQDHRRTQHSTNSCDIPSFAQARPMTLCIWTSSNTCDNALIFEKKKKVHSGMHSPGSTLESPNNLEHFENAMFLCLHVCNSSTILVLTWLKKLKKIEPCLATCHLNSHL